MFRCNFTKYLPWSVIPKVLNLSVLWMSTLLCWICVSSLNVNSLQKSERVFHYFFNNTNIGSSPGSYNSHTCWVQEFSHLGCETNTFKRLIGEPWFVYKGNWKKNKWSPFYLNYSSYFHNIHHNSAVSISQFLSFADNY